MQIESMRLTLRKAEENDLTMLLRLFCDEEMMRYLGGQWNQKQTEDSLHEWRDEWGREGHWFGVITIKENGEAIGMAGFSPDTIPDEVGLELSWFILPEHQKKGFATEITGALLRFAFVEIGAERVLAETHPGNPASNRVLEKSGFKCMGERRHNYDFLPGFDIQVLWGLSWEKWRKLQRGTAWDKS